MRSIKKLYSLLLLVTIGLICVATYYENSDFAWLLIPTAIISRIVAKAIDESLEKKENKGFDLPVLSDEVIK